MPDRPEKSAWLTSEGTTYVVALPADSGRSPIRDLIERVYHAESLRPVSRARTILRERIHADFPASIADRETVKVAAKRISAPSPEPRPAAGTVALPDCPPPATFGIPELIPGAVILHEEVPAWLELLKEKTTRARDQWTSDRPVAAILVDAEDRLIAYAWNTNARIRTRHAEWNLCESLARAGRSIPGGAKLYVSLKPCRMCAARIWEAAEDPTRLAVVYLENDPGPLAQETLLDSGSPARRRYLGERNPLYPLVVQSRYLPDDDDGTPAPPDADR